MGVGGIVYLTSPVATSLTLSLQLLGDYTDYGQRAKHSIWEEVPQSVSGCKRIYLYEADFTPENQYPLCWYF